MKYCFIVNPFAGKGKYTEELRKKIKSACEARQAEYDIFVSESIDAVKEYINSTVANREAGAEVGFFACGGDGTLCATVNVIMNLEDKEGVFLGLIPIGTGNDFVRNFGSSAPFMDIEAQLDSEAHFVDIIRCNDKYAINMVNIGFDCEVVCNTIRFKRNRFIPSKFAYIAGVLVTLIKKPGVNMNVSVNGGEYEKKELLLTTFANGEFCGGGFHSNPRAKMNDGNIDTLFIKDISRLKFITLISYYKKGTHLENARLEKIVSPYKLGSVDMVFDKETNISIDGEIVKENKLHMSIAKEELGFLVPRGADVKCLKAQEAEV